ncbi:MAG: zinc ribbon domain-containing protein [Lachnospiraceae bacterium]|nr:zinc ribbon domain-containing protein [Lachnospiraceae bacterium]
MICSKCGKECADGTKFCTECGAEIIAAETAQVEESVVTETEVPEETVAADVENSVSEAETEPEEVTEPAKADKEKPEKKKTVKEKKPGNKGIGKVIGIIAAVIVLILLCKAIFSGGSEYVTAGKNAIYTVERVNDDVIVLMENGKVIETGMERCRSVTYSQDRTIACFINEDDALLVIKKGKLVKTGIEGASNMQVSAYGDTIAYFTDTKDGFGTLNLYYTKNGKKKEIEEDVLVGSAVLSPNGETVAFVADYKESDNFRGYYSINGKKPVEVGKEKRVFAIADKAAYIYYMDDDRIYAMKKKKDAEKLASDMRYVDAFMNADCTEIMFINDDKTYISVKAGEKQKVSNEEFSRIVLPLDSMQAETYQNTRRGGINVTFTGADSLKEQVFYTGSRIVYVSKKGEGSTLASSVMDLAIAEDRESLVYLSYGGDVSKLTDFSKGGKETRLGGSDTEAEELYADGDLKYIYYINEDEELWCIKGKKAKKIANDVTAAAVTADGKNCYYVVEKEDLYYSQKAGKGKKITSSDDGVSCVRLGNDVMVGVGKGGDIVMSLVDGKKLKELFTME